MIPSVVFVPESACNENEGIGMVLSIVNVGLLGLSVMTFPARSFPLAIVTVPVKSPPVHLNHNNK